MGLDSQTEREFRRRLDTLERRTTTVYRELTWHGVILPAAAATTAPIFLDGEADQHRFSALLPDYTGGPLTVKMLRRSQLAVAGTVAVFTRAVQLFRASAGVNSLEGGVAMNFAGDDVLDHLDSWTYAEGVFQAGDVIRVDLIRDGASGPDTLTTGVVLDHIWAEYAGVA